MRKLSSFDLSFKNVALSIVFVLAFAMLINAAEGPQLLATVTKVKGSPQVSRPGAAAAAVKSGDYIYMGDTLKTDKDSKVTLLFEDGEIRVITSDSNVNFAQTRDYSKISSVAKVADTVAEAINSKSLEATFQEAVTGVKLSVGSKEKQEAPKGSSSGAIAPKEAESSLGGIAKKMEVSAQDASEGIAMREESSKSMPAPAPPPVMPSAAAPAPQSEIISENKADMQSSAAPSGIAADKSMDSGRAKLEVEYAAQTNAASSPAAGGSEPKKEKMERRAAKPAQQYKNVATKNWGRWLEGETMVSWNSLLPESIINKKVAKIIVQSSSTPQNVTDLSDSINLSGVLEEKVYFTVAVYGSDNNSLLTSFRAYFNNNSKSNEFVKKEIARFDKLKTDDMDTYLYAKAMTLKKYSYHVAALSALNQIEKNNPGITLPHIIRLKAAIYLGMGESELAHSEALRLKK